jgi:hypothetical protein
MELSGPVRICKKKKMYAHKQWTRIHPALALRPTRGIALEHNFSLTCEIGEIVFKKK